MQELLIALIAGGSGVAGALGAQVLGARYASRLESQRLRAQTASMLFATRVDLFAQFQNTMENALKLIASHRDAHFVDADERAKAAINAASRIESARELAITLCESIGLVAPEARGVCFSYADHLRILVFLDPDLEGLDSLGDLGNEIDKHRRVVRELLHSILVGEDLQVQFDSFDSPNLIPKDLSDRSRRRKP